MMIVELEVANFHAFAAGLDILVSIKAKADIRSKQTRIRKNQTIGRIVNTYSGSSNSASPKQHEEFARYS